MELSNVEPYVSAALARELLTTPPAPIPKSDPLLFGREVVLALRERPGGVDSKPAQAAAAPAAAAGPAAADRPPAAAASEPPCSGTTDLPAPQRYRQLPVRQATELSYDEFVREYLAPNRPVVIRGAAAGWRAAAEWRAPDGSLRLDALAALAGRCAVCVTDTARQGYSYGDVREMRMGEYLAWWAARRGRGQRAAPQQGTASAADKAGERRGSGEGGGETAGAEGAHGEQALQAQAEEAAGGAARPWGAQPALACEPGAAPGGEQLLYCKDWHFVAEFPDYGAYRLPVYFADDWLNAFYDTQAAAAAAAAAPSSSAALRPADGDDTPATAGGCDACANARAPGTTGQIASPPPAALPSSPAASPSPSPAAATTSDYRFCYLGPAGTWTPLHSDVLRSHSWSANIVGRKRWLMVPPQHTAALYDARGLRMAPHVEGAGERRGAGGGGAASGGGGGGGGGAGEGVGCGEGEAAAAEEFPHLRSVLPYVYEFVQETGDAVFVPAGWHHCVENLADTLSFNHNWLNGHSAHWTWALLRRQHVDAAAAIEDCRALCDPVEFEELVQSAVAANAGLGWAGFVDLLGCVAERGLAALAALAAAAGGGGPDSARGACEDGEGPGGRRCPPADAEWTASASAEELHWALLLQRAGLVLQDFCASFEELVLAPAEKRRRRLKSDEERRAHDEAMQRMRSFDSFAKAKNLLRAVGTALVARGISL